MYIYEISCVQLVSKLVSGGRKDRNRNFNFDGQIMHGPPYLFIRSIDRTIIESKSNAVCLIINIAVGYIYNNNILILIFSIRIL